MRLCLMVCCNCCHFCKSNRTIKYSSVPLLRIEGRLFLHISVVVVILIASFELVAHRNIISPDGDTKRSMVTSIGSILVKF